GDELVAACVELGTHYCDLSGEMQRIARMIERHHAAAQRSGARIVNACGYDSLPSDLGVFVLQQHALQTLGQPTSEIDALAYARGPNLSGGTFASMFNLVDEAGRDKAVRRLLFNPHGLAQEPRALTGSKREQHGVRYVADARVFTGPFLMAPANVRIVHRSNSLLDYRYGRDFVYNEAMPTGKGVGGALAAALLTGGLTAMMAGVGLPPVRALLKRVVPKVGTGPSEKAREKSSFAHELYATVGGKHLRARFAANGDPGYGETAKMLAESALCLAFDELPGAGGVLTGASAMGDALVKRLKKARFEIDAWTVSEARR
ncbi:MAG: saccharopine dehydrogenase, partial [Polyangiales bacterium]